MARLQKLKLRRYNIVEARSTKLGMYTPMDETDRQRQRETDRVRETEREKEK